jgi:hypothetical protein
MFTVIANIDVKKILDYYFLIEKDILWFDSGSKGRQSGIQFNINEDPYISATGRARFSDKNFDQLNSFYANSCIQDIIQNYKLYRTRWMWVNPFSCYSIHQDFTPRIHIPLITNDQCLFVFPPHRTFHLPIGKVYKVDTTKKHTFINCSEFPRLHLIGAT